MSALSHRFAQGRTHEEKESDHRRNRIAGQTEVETLANARQHDGFARLHRNAPELRLAAECVERVFDEVECADGDAARRQDEVAVERKSTRLNSSHIPLSRMPFSA